MPLSVKNQNFIFYLRKVDPKFKACLSILQFEELKDGLDDAFVCQNQKFPIDQVNETNSTLTHTMISKAESDAKLAEAPAQTYQLQTEVVRAKAEVDMNKSMMSRKGGGRDKSRRSQAALPDADRREGFGTH